MDDHEERREADGSHRHQLAQPRGKPRIARVIIHGVRPGGGAERDADDAEGDQQVGGAARLVEGDRRRDGSFSKEPGPEQRHSQQDQVRTTRRAFRANGQVQQERRAREAEEEDRVPEVDRIRHAGPRCLGRGRQDQRGDREEDDGAVQVDRQLFVLTQLASEGRHVRQPAAGQDADRWHGREHGAHVEAGEQYGVPDQRSQQPQPQPERDPAADRPNAPDRATEGQHGQDEANQRREGELGTDDRAGRRGRYADRREHEYGEHDKAGDDQRASSGRKIAERRRDDPGEWDSVAPHMASRTLASGVLSLRKGPRHGHDPSGLLRTIGPWW